MVLPFGIHVDPLVVRGRLGEFVDTVLVDDGPVGHADFLAFQRFRVFDGSDEVHNAC